MPIMIILFYSREAQSLYTITVTATDNLQASSTATVEVSLTDVNDKTPMIVNDP